MIEGLSHDGPIPRRRPGLPRVPPDSPVVDADGEKQRGVTTPDPPARGVAVGLPARVVKRPA